MAKNNNCIASSNINSSRTLVEMPCGIHRLQAKNCVHNARVPLCRGGGGETFELRDKNCSRRYIHCAMKGRKETERQRCCVHVLACYSSHDQNEPNQTEPNDTKRVQLHIRELSMKIHYYYRRFAACQVIGFCPIECLLFSPAPHNQYS